MTVHSDFSPQVMDVAIARFGQSLRRAVAICAFGLLVSGCVGTQGGDVTSDQAMASGAFSSQYVLSGAYLRDWQSALSARSVLTNLAERANDLTISRSPTLFELRAAESESAAERAAWFPQVRPVATAGFGGVSSGVGLSVTQLIYDFSQTRNRREQAEIRRVLTELDFWAERNDDVLDALNDYVDAIEAYEIIRTRNQFEHRLNALAEREAERLNAGVVAQGDALFIDVTRQENRRETIRARADLTEAQADLRQSAGVDASGDMGLRFSALEGACDRPRLRDYSPELLRARIALELAELEEDEARRGLFPRIVGQGTVISNEDGTSNDSAQIALEGGSLAGGGGRLRVEAAEQRIGAVEREMDNVRLDMSRELERLDAQRALLLSQQSDYRDLVRTNERSLELFQDRFAAGAASTSEAVRVEAERNANLVALVESRADIARNCLDAARVFGALSDADFGPR